MNMSGYNRGGFHQPVGGSFQASGMSGFQGSPMGGMQSYGGFQNRGAMMGGMRGGPMGIRGGRGGINSGGMMGMPMTGMGMGAMGGLGMSMPQLNGGMGMQGMQGSHFPPYMDHVGLQEVSASPKEQSLPPIPQATQNTNSSLTGLHTLPIRGRVATPAGSASSSAWALYTQYSPSLASSSPTRVFSQVNTPGIASNPPQHNTTLAGRSLLTGTQAHYNPAFFSQQQQGQPSSNSGDANYNPHGAKRTRQE